MVESACGMNETFFFSIKFTQQILKNLLDFHMWNELTFLWNELTILWNDLTIDWHDLPWNDLTMERNDRKSRAPKSPQTWRPHTKLYKFG